MKTEKNIRISDIARIAGVSTGTVDRVLHKRGRVSEEKRILVERILKEMNFTPNPLARSLANHKLLHIIALIPEYQRGTYWELIKHGIDKAGESLESFNISIKYLKYDQYDKDSFLKQTQIILNEKPKGVIIATHFERETRQFSASLDLLKIPYVFIDSNIEGCSNIAYFGVNSIQSGRLAADLFFKSGIKEGPILEIIYAGLNQEISLQSRLREKGFVDYLREKEYTGSYKLLVLESNNMSQNALLLKQQLEEDKPKGIVVFNSKIYELLRILPLDFSYDQIQLIGYDTIAANVEALIDGRITWLIGQRAESQGYDCVKALSNYLILNQSIQQIQYMPIDILSKENISFYHNFNF